jgi:hypothetical protein
MLDLHVEYNAIIHKMIFNPRMTIDMLSHPDGIKFRVRARRRAAPPVPLPSTRARLRLGRSSSSQALPPAARLSCPLPTPLASLPLGDRRRASCANRWSNALAVSATRRRTSARS